MKPSSGSIMELGEVAGVVAGRPLGGGSGRGMDLGL